MIPFHDLVGPFDRPECGAAKYRGDRMCLEFERYHDPEIPAAATDGPEQVGVLVFVHGNKTAIG